MGRCRFSPGRFLLRATGFFRLRVRNGSDFSFSSPAILVGFDLEEKTIINP
jgi:hypothetical protein